MVPGKAIILCSETAMTTTEIRTTEPPAVVNTLWLGFRIRIRVTGLGLGLRLGLRLRLLG